MAAHNGAITTVLLTVLGAKFIGDAISGLAAYPPAPPRTSPLADRLHRSQKPGLLAWRQRATFSMAAGVTGVKKLTRLPSGSRNSSDRLPQGIVVGSVTKSATKPIRFW